IQNGAFKAYAIGSSKRNPALPGVPTSGEAGLPQFQASAWNALFAPKGTPKPILDKLSDALDKAIDDENTQKRLLILGSEIPDARRRRRAPPRRAGKRRTRGRGAVNQGGGSNQEMAGLGPPPPARGPR